jgi:transposase
MPDCILAPSFAARSRIFYKSGFRLEFPIVWQHSLKSIAMTLPILGVDIAKDKFDCVLLVEAKQHRQSFPNTVLGWKKLDQWLEKNAAKTVHACMEATGRLWQGLAQHLHEASHRVSVVNPVRIKRYAQSRLSRNKNDAVDSALIAFFCREQNPPVWNPPSPGQSQLQELTRLMSARKQQVQEEKNRLKSGSQNVFVLAEIRRTIKNLLESIKRLEKEIQSVLAREADLGKKAELLCSIPGISDRTVAVILAELPDPQHFTSASQVAAYAGVTPAQRESGSSLHGKTHLCKTGNSRLRTALYFPAVVASRRNPLLKARAARLLAAGKTKMCVIGAIMHHLLRLAYGVLKHGKPFDLNFASQTQSA